MRKMDRDQGGVGILESNLWLKRQLSTLLPGRKLICSQEPKEAITELQRAHLGSGKDRDTPCNSIRYKHKGLGPRHGVNCKVNCCGEWGAWAEMQMHPDLMKIEALNCWRRKETLVCDGFVFLCLKWEPDPGLQGGMRLTVLVTLLW